MKIQVYINISAHVDLRCLLKRGDKSNLTETVLGPIVRCFLPRQFASLIITAYFIREPIIGMYQ